LQLSWHRDRDGEQRKIGRRGDCPGSVAIRCPRQDCQKHLCWRLEPVLAGPISEPRICSRTMYCNLVNSGAWEQEQPAVRTTADWPRARIRPNAWLPYISSAQFFSSGSAKVRETALTVLARIGQVACLTIRLHACIWISRRHCRYRFYRYSYRIKRSVSSPIRVLSILAQGLR